MCLYLCLCRVSVSVPVSVSVSLSLPPSLSLSLSLSVVRALHIIGPDGILAGASSPCASSVALLFLLHRLHLLLANTITSLGVSR